MRKPPSVYLELHLEELAWQASALHLQLLGHQDLPPNPSVVAPGANLSFFTDPLSVGPSQIPPTGPIGSDPLRVGPAQMPSGRGGAAALSGSSSSESCGFPNCLPGED